MEMMLEFIALILEGVHWYTLSLFPVFAVVVRGASRLLDTFVKQPRTPRLSCFAVVVNSHIASARVDFGHVSLSVLSILPEEEPVHLFYTEI